MQVGGCKRLWSVYPLENPEPHGRNAIADAIETSPPEATHSFEYGVRDLADDLGGPRSFGGAFYRLPESASCTEPPVQIRFIAAVIPI